MIRSKRQVASLARAAGQHAITAADALDVAEQEATLGGARSEIGIYIKHAEREVGALTRALAKLKAAVA